MTAPALTAAANMTAFWPLIVSFAFTSAPCSSSTVTASGFPAAAASMSAVVPALLGAARSAPLSSSSSIIAALPFLAAMRRGVNPPFRSRGTHACSRFEEDARHLRVVSIRCPVQRRAAVSLGLIDVHVVRQQPSHLNHVSLHGCVGYRVIHHGYEQHCR